MTAMVEAAERVLETVENELPASFRAKLCAAVCAGMKRHAAMFRNSDVATRPRDHAAGE